METRHFEVQFGRWVISNRWWVIAGTVFLVLVAASGMRILEFSSNYRMFFSEDNPQLLALESMEDAYGKSDNVLFMVVPDDHDALSEQALAAAAWLTEHAWQTPYSTRVDSITNFLYTTAEDDDLIVRELVDPARLGEPDKRSRVRSIALSDPRLVGSLVARDGHVSAVNVTVALPEEGQTAILPQIAAFSRTLSAEAEARFPGIDIRPVGLVIINSAFMEASISSQKIFLPVSLAVMALVLGILTRSLAGVVATGLVIIFSVLVSMGLGGWVGLPVTPATAPAPTIVLMIAVANCVHLLVGIQQRLGAGDSKSEALVESLRINLQPVFIASLTTALGFLTMNFSEVPPYRDLGNFVAIGIGASFVLSVTLLPVMLSLLPRSASAGRRHDDPWMTAIAEFVIRRQTVLLWTSGVVVLALLVAIPKNELNDVMTHFFDERTELRQDTDFLDAHLSGNTVLEYSLLSAGPGGIVDPAYLRDLAAFAEWFTSQPQTRNVRVISDTFRQINQSMHGGDPAAYHIPESRELASQYLLLYELSLPFGFDLNNQMDIAKSATRMTVSMSTLSSRQVLEMNARALAWLEENAPHIKQVESAGPAIMFSHIGQRNIRAMLMGTAIALLGISLFLIVPLRSLRMGLISLVPNFVPAVMGFGVWGLAVGQIGLSLSVVVAMTIGIVVDDTVHFISKYRRARTEYGYSPEDAVRLTLQTVGRALFTTTTILVAGFLILVLSVFTPTAQVGMLTALIVGFAFIADILLLPPLLMVVDRHETPGGLPASTHDTA